MPHNFITRDYDTQIWYDYRLLHWQQNNGDILRPIYKKVSYKIELINALSNAWMSTIIAWL